MKYALSSNGNRIEASKGAEGFCPICKEKLIPRCGMEKSPHWAHRKSSLCESWSSTETEWHLNWKNQFPEDWQEVLCHNDTIPGIHIADVKTPEGTVLEFQHSPISDEDKISREVFYQNMLWIVDLHKRQWISRFSKALYANDRFLNLCCLNAQEIFPSEWLNRNVFVIFDYKGTTEDNSLDNLICIVPTIGKRQFSYIYPLSRERFIKGITDNSVVTELRNYQKRINDHLTDIQASSKKEPIRNSNSVYQQVKLPVYRRLNRRKFRF